MKTKMLTFVVVLCVGLGLLLVEGISATAGHEPKVKDFSFGIDNKGPVCDYQIVDPASWYHPPLKVAPGASRILILKILSIGNENLLYQVSSDDDCIVTPGAMPPLAPGDSAIIAVTVYGTGGCDSTFIDGNVILVTNEASKKIYYLPVQAVVAEDYYECPIDSETVDTLDNGVLRLYVNANCGEWIHDIGTFPDTVHEVFFAGGTIVATTSGNDTLVGRFMDSDWHAGAQDKLYTELCEVDWEPDFWLVYTKDIFIHDLEPPMNPKWWWWEVSKQIKFFKETAPDVYKHLVIKYVTVKRKDPPTWWPDQTPFSGYEDTYIGVAMDIDCPWDTLGTQNGRNLAGYDDVNHIAYQVGWDWTGAHPEYNNYHCGIALADAGMSGEDIVPYGSYNVLTDEYLYPQDGWGWKDGELYQLAATAGNQIDDPDSAVDRAQVFAAHRIAAGIDTSAEASFTLVEVVAPVGLVQLQEYVDSARAIVAREATHGIPAVCGDVDGDGAVSMVDILVLSDYYYNGGSIPCPISRGDLDGSGGSPDLGDLLLLINYFFKSGPPPDCPGLGFSPYGSPCGGYDPLDPDTLCWKTEDAKVTPGGTDIPVTIWGSNDEDIRAISIPLCWTGDAYLDPDKNVTANPTSEYYIFRDYNGEPNRLQPYLLYYAWNVLFPVDSLNNRSLLFAHGSSSYYTPLEPGSGLLATFIFTCGQPTAPQIDTCFYPPFLGLSFVDTNNNCYVPQFGPCEAVELDCDRSYSDACLVACPLGDIPFKVYLKDSDGNPVANYSNVRLDFSACSGIIPCTTETSWPIVHPDGPSDASGIVTFYVRAGGCDNTCHVSLMAGCGLIGYVPVKTVDMDGDLMVRVNDWHGIGVDSCNDYNCNGEINYWDLDFFSDHIAHSCVRDSCLLLYQNLTVIPDTLLPVGSTHKVRLFIKNNNAMPCSAQFVKFYRAGFGQGTSLFQFATNYVDKKLMPGDTVVTEADFVVPGPGSGYILTKLYTDCCDHSVDAIFDFTKRMCPPDSMVYIFPLLMDVVPTSIDTLEYMPDEPGWYWFIYETGGVPDSVAIVTPDTSVLGTTGGVNLWFYDEFESLLCYRSCKVRITLNSGDVNSDCIVNLGDVLYLISYLYKGGPSPNPHRAGDVNCDGTLDLGDLLYLISYLYKGGPAPVSSETCEYGYKESFPY